MKGKVDNHSNVMSKIVAKVFDEEFVQLNTKIEFIYESNLTNVFTTIATKHSSPLVI